MTRSETSTGPLDGDRDRPTSLWRRVVASIGPAMIVACVVLGPGSILTSSKVGCQFEYQLLWVLAAAGVLMAATVAGASLVGIAFERSPCEELARRIGRPASVLAGASVFCIAACFQYSNNLGVLAAIEPLTASTARWQPLALAALNGGLILCLFGFKRLYGPIEKLMMAMMGLMLVGFAANLWFAQPSFAKLAAGLMPSLPSELSGSLLPQVVDRGTDAERLLDPWLVVQGLIVTTFSVAGAFYQAYLVKEKGWTVRELRYGLVDSVVGTFVLVGVSAVIMATSAAVLYGRIDPSSLQSAADVARQLEPLFGAAAKWLFCLGIFAGALSSFLVNSMIGGTMMADGLGLDAKLDSRAVKIFTTAALLIGMTVALWTDAEGRVPLIIFAQAMTALGGPLLILALAYLLHCARVESRIAISHWITSSVWLGAVVVIVLAARTVLRIWPPGF